MRSAATLDTASLDRTDPLEGFEVLERAYQQRAAAASPDEDDEPCVEEENEGGSMVLDDDMEELDAELDLQRDMSKAGRKRARKSSGSGGKLKLPQHLEGKMGRANAAYMESDLMLAAKLLLEIIQDAPGVPDTYHTLGLVYEELGHKKEAVKVFMMAAWFSPKDVELCRRIAPLARDIDDLETAIICYTRIIRMDSGDTSNEVWERCLLYRQQSDNKKAIFGLQTLNRKFPFDPEIVRELAGCLYDLGRRRAAFQQLEAYMEHARAQVKNLPNNDTDEIRAKVAALWDCSIVNLICDVYLIKEAFNLVLSIVEETKLYLQCDVLPDALEGKQASALIRKGEGHSASAKVNRLYNLRSRDLAATYIDLGNAYAEMHYPNDALRLYDIVEKLGADISLPHLWFRQARCYFELGDLPRAKALCLGARKHSPKDLECALLLTRVLDGLGENEAALLIMEQMHALEVESDHASDDGNDYDDEDELSTVGPTDFKIGTNEFELLLQAVRLLSKVDDTGKVLDVALHRVEQKLETLMSRLESGTKRSRSSRQIRINPQTLGNGAFAELAVLVAMALLRRGEINRADRILTGVMSIARVDRAVTDAMTRIRSMFGCLRAQEGQLDVAYSTFSLVVAVSPDDDSLFNAVAHVISTLGFPDKCRRFTLRFAAKHPDKVPAQVLLGHFALERRSYAKAARYYATALKHAPNDPAIALLSAVAHIQMAGLQSTARPRDSLLHGFSCILHHYRLLRGSSAASFNVARAFHSIGLVHIAMRFYDRAIATAASRPPEISPQFASQCSPLAICLGFDRHDALPVGASQHAAINLAAIYAQTGALELARQLLFSHVVF